MIKFLFDLDGTLTKVESLPLIANHFKNYVNPIEITELTNKSLANEISYEECLKYRVNTLKNIPVDEVAKLLENIELFESILSFIQENKENCTIVTSNIKDWIALLCKRIGCNYYSSIAKIENNAIVEIEEIIKKEEIVKKYKNQGYYVVFIGDAINDANALEEADYSILAGMVHKPLENLEKIADFTAIKEEDIYAILNSILQKYPL